MSALIGRLAAVGAGVSLSCVACADPVAPAGSAAPAGLGRTDVKLGAMLPQDALVAVGAFPSEEQTPAQLGSADVDVSLAQAKGGRLEPVQGPEGQPAFSFPPFHPVGSYAQAVIVVRNTTPSDVLSPRKRNFSFGATFRLDDQSFGRAEDNGNNVVQRGLYSDPVQFKLEVDETMRPGCTVRTPGHEASVIAVEPLEPGTWYHVQCQRRPGALAILVMVFEDGAWTTPLGRVDLKDVGPVDFVNPATPMSVGGKVDDGGEIVIDSSDLFNGEITDAFLSVG